MIVIIAVRKFKYSKKLVNSINKKYTNIDSYADYFFYFFFSSVPDDKIFDASFTDIGRYVYCMHG